MSQQLSFDDPFDGGTLSVELIAKFIKLFSAESDYGSAMMTGALIDTGLKNLIAQIFPTSQKQKMFDDRHFLSSISAKINFIHAVGVFTKDDFAIFSAVRQVRNCFAHPAGNGESFNQPSKKLSKWLGNLTVPASTQAKLAKLGMWGAFAESMPARMRYEGVVMTLTGYLSALRRGAKPMAFRVAS
ncbi:MAG: hypothetical protein IH963_11620 [Chloroflexi bacterium]|nr:hypothetical protein [Chloroflexota bacterium]